jgi:hypothetical protein
MVRTRLLANGDIGAQGCESTKCLLDPLKAISLVSFCYLPTDRAFWIIQHIAHRPGVPRKNNGLIQVGWAKPIGIKIVLRAKYCGVGFGGTHNNIGHWHHSFHYYQ